jgi:hypothetical protein
VKELDPDNALAAKTVQRLTPVVNERREKMKEEMLGAPIFDYHPLGPPPLTRLRGAEAACLCGPWLTAADCDDCFFL